MPSLLDQLVSELSAEIMGDNLIKTATNFLILSYYVQGKEETEKSAALKVADWLDKNISNKKEKPTNKEETRKELKEMWTSICNEALRIIS